MCHGRSGGRRDNAQAFSPDVSRIIRRRNRLANDDGDSPPSNVHTCLLHVRSPSLPRCDYERTLWHHICATSCALFHSLYLDISLTATRPSALAAPRWCSRSSYEPGSYRCDRCHQPPHLWARHTPWSAPTAGTHIPAVSRIGAGCFPLAMPWSSPRLYSANPSQCSSGHQIVRRWPVSVAGTH